jgi:5-methylcytosine-specific restriction enzyme subunit McrC
VGRVNWDEHAGTDTMGDASGLVPAFANILARQAERALAQGVLQGYRTAEASSTVLRGRMRETDQLYQGRGIPVPLEIRYDELTTDIPENQILRTALGRMLGVPGLHRDLAARRLLSQQLPRLREVTPIPRGGGVPRWSENRLNLRYVPALRLAELVLAGRSVEQRSGLLTADGFLVDMEDVFEDFVCLAFADELRRSVGGRRRTGPFHLDTTGHLKLEPDLVWERDGLPVAVVDAKYMLERKKIGGTRDAIFQMLGYCTALGLRRGHLIYAQGHRDPWPYTIGPSGMEIVCHSLDLNRDPKAVLDQVRDVVARIRASLQ